MHTSFWGNYFFLFESCIANDLNQTNKISPTFFFFYPHHTLVEVELGVVEPRLKILKKLSFLSRETNQSHSKGGNFCQIGFLFDKVAIRVIFRGFRVAAQVEMPDYRPQHEITDPRSGDDSQKDPHVPGHNT